MHNIIIVFLQAMSICMRTPQLSLILLQHSLFMKKLKVTPKKFQQIQMNAINVVVSDSLSSINNHNDRTTMIQKGIIVQQCVVLSVDKRKTKNSTLKIYSVW